MNDIRPSRRMAAGGLLAGIVSVSAFAMRATDGNAAGGAFRPARDVLSSLEARSGGRLGVKAIDVGNGQTVEYRPHERFPMCSTHKTISAAAVLRQVDVGALSLDHRVAFGKAQLLDYAPIAKKHVEAGFMTVEALCEAAIRWSDNTAANLLLSLADGPAGWTSFARSLGDADSRLDRVEPDLNTAVPGDARDTTTPTAMAAMLASILFGTVLSNSSRTRLRRWMSSGEITASLFRAGLPRDWQVADKSGSGENGTRNDAGILSPPMTAPILLAVYLTGSSLLLPERDHIVAEATRTVVRSLREA